jgi:DNA-binding winged helix-turn-helix (wHTH) protein
MTQPDPQAPLRFGEYVLDVERQGLFRGKHRVRLERKPLALLTLLVAKRGAIVTRLDIESCLWPPHQEIDVEAGISTAIRKVRRALRDSFSKPRFIETVPGQGYRFVATVSVEARRQADPTFVETSSHLVELLRLGRRPRAAHDLMLDTPPSVTATESLGSWSSATRGDGVVEPTPVGDEGISLQVGSLSAGDSRSRWPLRPLPVSLFVTAALATGLAMFTQAVGVAAVLYGLFFALLVGGYHLLADSALMRAWTLFELAGEVVNFNSIGPAALYPFVTGLQFLPLFALVLMCWTASAVDDVGRPLLTGPAFWTTGALFLSLTAAALAAYSGEMEVWRRHIPGSKALALCYSAVILVNVGLAWRALRELRGRSPEGSRRVLVLAACAYLVVLPPAIGIGAIHNSITRSFLSSRRTQAYRARNPRAAVVFAEGLHLSRRDIGPALRSLLRDPDFLASLRSAVFYKVDFDERFQVLGRAVMFGYERSRTQSEVPLFRVVRFPRDVAEAIDFELTESPNQARGP